MADFLEIYNLFIAVGGVVAGLAYSIVTQMVTANSNQSVRVVVIGLMSVSGALLLASVLLFTFLVLYRNIMPDIVEGSDEAVLVSSATSAYLLLLTGLILFASGGAALGFLHAKWLGIMTSILTVALFVFVFWRWQKRHTVFRSMDIG